MFSIYRLPNKLPNEKVLKIIRKDVFVLLKSIIMLIFLTILPLAFFYLTIRANPGLVSGEISYPIIVLGTSAYYLFAWLFFFFSFVDYYLDVWVITDQRIIDIEQRGFFSRIISEQKLFRVQDITSEAHGIFPTMFRFGDVHIQTAGTKQRFFFNEVPDPDGIRDMIIRLVERNKRIHKEELKEETGI